MENPSGSGYQPQDAQLMQFLGRLANADLSNLSIYLQDYNWKLLATVMGSLEYGGAQAYLAKGPLPSSGIEVAAVVLGVTWTNFLNWYITPRHALMLVPSDITSNTDSTVAANVLTDSPEDITSLSNTLIKLQQLPQLSAEEIRQLPILLAEQIYQYGRAVATLQIAGKLWQTEKATSQPALVNLEAKSKAVTDLVTQATYALAAIAQSFNQGSRFKARSSQPQTLTNAFEDYHRISAELPEAISFYQDALNQFQEQSLTLKAASGSDSPVIKFDQGYVFLYKGVQTEIADKVNRFIGNNFDLYVVGHTQASPIAQLAALDLRPSKSQVKTISCYTFSTPAMGDQKFVEFFQQNVPNNFSVQAQRVDFFPSSPNQTNGYYAAAQAISIPAQIPQYDAPWFERSEIFYQQCFGSTQLAWLQEAAVSLRAFSNQSEQLAIGYALAQSVASFADSDLPPGYSEDFAYTLAILCAIAYQRFQHPDLTAPTPSPWQIISNFSAGNTVFGTLFQSPEQVAVVFRGTVSWQELIEILGNRSFGWFNFLPREASQISKGIGTLYSNLRQDLFDKLKAVNDLNKKQLIITGHCVGGGLATLCGLDLSQPQPGIPVPNNIYTFGSPSIGSNAFMRYFNLILSQKSYRVVRDWDIVPKLFLSSGYWPVDKVVSIPGSNLDDDYACHSISSYIKLLNPTA